MYRATFPQHGKSSRGMNCALVKQSWNHINYVFWWLWLHYWTLKHQNYKGASRHTAQAWRQTLFQLEIWICLISRQQIHDLLQFVYCSSWTTPESSLAMGTAQTRKLFFLLNSFEDAVKVPLQFQCNSFQTDVRGDLERKGTKSTTHWTCKFSTRGPT